MWPPARQSPGRRRLPDRRRTAGGPLRQSPWKGPPRVILVQRANTIFQHLQALKGNRTKRHRTGEFLVEGVRAIDRARANAWPMRALVYAGGRPLSSWARQTLAAERRAMHVEVDPALMAQLSEKDDSSELIAVAAMPEESLKRIRLRWPTLVLVFDRPVSPGNLGTTIRSCDALAADGLIVTGHGADPYDPLAVRASQGALFDLPVVQLASHDDVQHWIGGLPRREAPQLVGADAGGVVALEAVDLTRPTVLVVGNETRGLSRAYRDLCDVLATIPMAGVTDSLNVACAASIVLYEAGRQRRLARAAAAPPAAGTS